MLGDSTSVLRRELNRKALDLVGKLNLHTYDLEGLLALSSLANSVDVWMPWTRGLLELKGRVRGDIATATRLLESAHSIAYLLDNAGEAVIDLAVSCELSRRGWRVLAVARSEPYEVDITVSEAKWVLEQLDGILDCEGVKIIGTGSRYPVAAYKFVSRSTLSKVSMSDAIISKGIANFEALIEYRTLDPLKTIVLLRAKCPVIARLLHVSLGDAYVGVGYP